ncbi:hypothetical protein E6P09_17265 (plasmid) [Haloferax mediterranei ATCC 33500]|uniref:Uncharacterized protein n=1 Tax=Haloferax mediterranei (strain ATCC 33500 / DSM 1411 / JCM 8866 / NBRC 14739 / NCIMB 2177 / R-4) TaxID=523841 RepID=I3RAI0_HALMT|nr:hypothetical protein [Haloferax mediterranei]AFK21240.1 hypothetical protein HFX_6115 [Haloferax mediterranei ATCC 33500]AHZ24658.1 hypothetical protein BM92_17355 [Haloferax mediterranei ATCC 33500]ELZ97430.1 hypothetical protein C439_18948 [Haloferax mediterranei ATCC 33500]QCQ77054.1 hypothetical protein E6P09_17265 [Haloferax mediterranei ATCC 33500]
MTGQDESTASESVSGAPIDFDRLGIIRNRFTTDERFTQVVDQPEFAPERLVCVYDGRFYPSSVQNARLELVWFENGDFSLHYHEDHDEGTFDHRWDRHPSDHNTRDHIHPGPDAPTHGDDTSHPSDWRDVLSMALTEIETRQRAFWEG